MKFWQSMIAGGFVVGLCVQAALATQASTVRYYNSAEVTARGQALVARPAASTGGAAVQPVGLFSRFRGNNCQSCQPTMSYSAPPMMYHQAPMHGGHCCPPPSCCPPPCCPSPCCPPPCCPPPCCQPCCPPPCSCCGPHQHMHPPYPHPHGHGGPPCDCCPPPCDCCPMPCRKPCCKPLTITPDDCLPVHPAPCKCNHECCQWVKEPYIDWIKEPVWLDGWEYAVVENKCPFCKTDCPHGPNHAECCEVYGIMTKKELVKQPKKIKAYCFKPVLKCRWVKKCVKCGMCNAGGPFHPGGPHAGMEVSPETIPADSASPQTIPGPQPAMPGPQLLNRPDLDEMPATPEEDMSTDWEAEGNPLASAQLYIPAELREVVE